MIFQFEIKPIGAYIASFFLIGVFMLSYTNTNDFKSQQGVSVVTNAKYIIPQNNSPDNVVIASKAVLNNLQVAEINTINVPNIISGVSHPVGQKIVANTNIGIASAYGDGVPIVNSISV